MARQATGQVLTRKGARGTTYALRFRAYGKRRYVTLGSRSDGWSEQKAREQLANVLADVRRGIWRVPVEETAETFEEVPTFHEFATDWLKARQDELRPNTVLDYTWQLSNHLLPFFAGHTIDSITIAEVDRYRVSKVREGTLSATSINKTLTRLAQILDVAVEYGLIATNPARGRRRRLKQSTPPRAFLEVDQVNALLDCARRHRPLVATLVLAGLRISEATGLLWRDVDLASGKLFVRAAKTDAGVRTVMLTPDLSEVLTEHKARTAFGATDDFVFATTRGTELNRNNVRTRIIKASIERANVTLAEAGSQLIGPDVTTHSLRRTCISLMLEAGAPLPEVMAKVGHTDPKVTLGVYGRALHSQRETGRAVDALLAAARASSATHTDAPLSPGRR